MPAVSFTVRVRPGDWPPRDASRGVRAARPRNGFRGADDDGPGVGEQWGEGGEGAKGVKGVVGI